MAKLLSMAAIALALGWAAPDAAFAGCPCDQTPQAAAAPYSAPTPANSQATNQRQQNRRYSYSPSPNSAVGSYRSSLRARNASQSGYGRNFWRADRKIRGL